jgi:hypothetical protein
MITILGSIAAATQRVGVQINSKTAELKGLRYPKNIGNIFDNEHLTKLTRKTINIVSEDTNIYTEILRTSLPLLTSSRIAAMDAFTNALSLYKEVSGNNTAGLADARSQLRNLLSTVSGSIEKLTDFRSTVDGVPRMSSDLNRAKRALWLNCRRV